MGSIGEKLKSTRESKNITIKDVGHDTNISSLYIEALEEEEFERFPSETYLIGFLRSYSQYLKLDADEMIQAYKGYKIGESVTPLEELTKPTRPSIMIFFSSFINTYRNFIFIISVMVFVLAVIWGIREIISGDIDVNGGSSIDNIKNEYTAKNKDLEIENVRNLSLHNDSGYILVYKNEAIQFMVDSKEVVFLLNDISKDSVTLELLPGKQLEKIDLLVPRTLKLEGCPREVTFSLKGLTENRAKIMVQLGEKQDTADKEAVDSESSEGEDNTNVIAQDKRNLKIVFEAEFTQKSFIELYLDGSRKKRGFIPKGSRERWEASEYIQIKIGNAGGLNVRINGKGYVFGGAGQVANKVITWKKDVNNPNLYHIVVKDW